eukprot:CAMPEP_0113309396 /NCGR_PEP_ID=MMETSP0010_2-20120614/7460_1 /TAXON_ID=216773 ORGANISM="Corethron hystrix, Strain 308" /NCGR_SAMPLE_ID=MMETSP0010_2 /ASSEMBLY_ACC=CAM_ASM_000155 /LENGTH=120 /DNA_ID=CAMNT_0000164647 /DNA_START=1218 /DNA_END=1580 /DNA_ORIENTATION=- /assembly_acc=CAM_ASM_000155
MTPFTAWVALYWVSRIFKPTFSATPIMEGMENGNSAGPDWLMSERGFAVCPIGSFGFGGDTTAWNEVASLEDEDSDGRSTISSHSVETAPSNIDDRRTKSKLRGLRKNIVLNFALYFKTM